ncbi:MAG: Fe(2+)-trafficking protein, partial [Anaerolineae bacterium]
NHYGLSLGDPNAQDFLLQQMEQFFFSDEGQMPEGWTTPGGGQKQKGGAARK